VKSIIIHPEARAELKAAAAYYEGKRKGLGREFREDVDDALARIAGNPKVFLVVEKIYRRCLLQRFPYTMFFQEHDDVIEVLAVAHQRRQPGYWLGRSTN
jgi:toxin ParE1/3/4